MKSPEFWTLRQNSGHGWDFCEFFAEIVEWTEIKEFTKNGLNFGANF